MNVYGFLCKGWSIPSSDVNGVATPKDLGTWSKNEINECDWNNKSLHAIFVAISPKEFKHVSMLETAMEAWNILETTHEVTKMVKNSKLQVLTTRFAEFG